MNAGDEEVRTNERKVARLAIRTEGRFVNAYLAMPDTMTDAILLCSVLRGACERDAAVFDAFKALARLILTEAFRQSLGVTPSRWDEEPAPEHERSGDA